MVETTDTTEQLVDIYLDEETWHKSKLDRETATHYYKTLFTKGNIIVWADYGKVVGYVEFWRVNYEQFGRIVCGESFCADGEDIRNGKICYVSDIWIKKERRSKMFDKMCKLEFFKRNATCDYFVWERRTKNNQPLKVFNRQQFISKLQED